MQRTVAGPVAASMQTVPVGFARRCWDWGDTALRVTA